MIKQCPRCHEIGNARCSGMMNGRSFTCSNCDYWGSHYKWDVMPPVVLEQ